MAELMKFFMLVAAFVIIATFVLSYAAKVVFRCSLISGCYFCLLTFVTLLCTSEQPFTFISSEFAGWALYSNFFQNTYLMWRFDPLLTLTQLLFAPTHETRFICLMAVTWYGTYRFMASIGFPVKPSDHDPFSPPLLIKSFLATIPVSILAVDGVALSAFAWIPLLAALLREEATRLVNELNRPKKRKKKKLGGWKQLERLLPLTVGALFLAMGANHFALLAAGCAFMISWFSGSYNTTDGIGHCDLRSRGRLALMVFIPSLITTLLIPSAPFPDYPSLAHLVPDDGLAGIVRPLIGADYPLSVINSSFCRAVYGSLALTLVLASLWVLRCAHEFTVARYNRFVLTAEVFFLLVLFDTVLPVEWSLISPLSSLSRLLPWGTTVYYPSLILGLAVWSFSVGLIQVAAPSMRLGELFALSVVLLSANVYSGTKSTSPAPSNPLPQITSPSAYVFRYLLQSLPSLAASERAPLEAMVHKSAIAGTTNAVPHSLHDMKARIYFSTTNPFGRLNPPQATQDMTRQRHLTTWNWRRGTQRGDEVVKIEFPQPVAMVGIELNQGTFTTDFPRGLILAGGPCDEDDSRTLIRQFSSWQGSIEHTADGYPYFSGQDSVRIDLPELPIYRCLYIHQTGTASYDWTIADITLFTR